MPIRFDSQGNELKDIRQLQEEISRWSQDQFGDNVSKYTGEKLYSQSALTGIVEEVGELNHATICMHQGRRGYDPTTSAGQTKYAAARNDAIADIGIFLLDYCAREGVDFLELVNSTWNNVVSKRTTQTQESWEKHTHETPAAEPPLYGYFVFGDKVKDEFLRLCGDIHKMPEETVVKFVRLALTQGWKVQKAAGFSRMIHRGDESDNWAAQWKTYTLEYENPDCSLDVEVPHWLARRMMELGQIPSGFDFYVEAVDRNGKSITNSAGEPITVLSETEPDRRMSREQHREQTGQGWAEPPVEEPVAPEKFARDRDYPHWCSACGKVPVHRTSSSGLCPDCGQQARRRRGEI